MRLIEFKKRTYYLGRYITTGISVNADEISRVLECKDDYTCTNVVTKDGKIYVLNERYEDVIKKIRECIAKMEVEHE